MNASLQRHLLRAAAFVYVAVMVSGCSWFTDFKRQPSWHPWQSEADTIPARGNPQNSVSVFGSIAPGFM